MSNNILIILNTVYHVEVALSIYKTLTLLGFKPIIFILWPNNVKYNLAEYLFLNKIDFITDYVPGVCKTSFSKAIIVSAYPTIERPDAIPGLGHPLFDEFAPENTILIAHRVNMGENSHKILCVTPLAKYNNLDYIYLCENPTEKDQIQPCEYPVRFLIQGNFFTKRRDLYLIEDFLYRTNINPKLFQFVFVGNNKSNPILKISHPSVIQLENLSESDFYKEINNCHYILPLISSRTGAATYLNERLSSSLSLSFCFNKPMIIDREINKIYNAPALEHANDNEFFSNLSELIKIDSCYYYNLVGYCKQYKEKLREYNKEILLKYLI